ncbi:MerC mercury resistance protein [Catalinimonas alkaloidigena]|uniref:MerC mercury resistance protein n=1 Tax=Catalinimonas alkaloidigena TaxID=1075417 RepID=A0A1G9VFR4_9BACT|nr:MerC domain-containing protein [Catalinimonas alkaloidigena]SDM70959.1 MerC mercury resistance protein [Catalinimonas alkaloidigena]
MKDQFMGLHWDFVGFSASLLCAFHCAALPFLLSLAPLAGLQFLHTPWIEYTILLVSFLVASYALIQGYRRHHHKPTALLLVTFGFLLISTGHFLPGEWQELLLSSGGAILIALAHLLNWKLIRQSPTELSTARTNKTFQPTQ